VAKLRPVEADFVRTAPKRWVFEASVPASRERVFAAVGGDAAGWKTWFPGFAYGAYEGTPGLGAVRIVKYLGTTFHETIVVWDEPSRWAFRVNSSTVPMARALVEEWTFEHGDGTTLVRWTFAIDPKPWFALFAPVARRYMARLFRRAMRNLGDVLSRQN
jgi:hypothetical protein